MRTVGLRELRQEASDLVRQVESGQEIEITVSGRPAARMIPAAPKRWRRWDHVADLFTGRPDPDWRRDAELDHYCSDMTRGMRYPNRIVGLHHDGDIGLNLPPSIARSRTDEHAFWLHTRADERLP